MSSAVGQACEPVLLNTFTIRKKKCRVYFHRGTLIWETEIAPYTRNTVSMTDVLAVHYGTASDVSHNFVDNKCTDGSPTHTSFSLYYVVSGSKNKLNYQVVTMNHIDPRQIASWVKTIRNYIESINQRPNHVLLFVNPYGGKRKGFSIYEKKVKPLFALAGIQATVVITERANHARDVILNHSFENIDAVVCIGGDGTFSEIFNGLVLRAAKDHGVDCNDPTVQLPSPALPVGIIPGGSTDTMAYCFHGTNDVKTAILHIILGDKRGVDLCSVHSNAKLLHLYSSVISYGYLGDVIRDSEKFRWMGPKRYDYSGFKKFLANKGYEGEITLLADESDPSLGPKCYSNCKRCNLFKEKIEAKEHFKEGEWKVLRGKYFMVNGANVSCACAKSPNGIAPFTHIGDGCVDVIMIKHSNLVNNLRLLLRLTSKEKSMFDLPFVEVHRAREFTFRALPATVSSVELGAPRLIPGLSVWNCDGEVQWETNMRVSVLSEEFVQLPHPRNNILLATFYHQDINLTCKLIFLITLLLIL